MRLRLGAALLLVVTPAAMRADSYSFFNFDGVPATYVAPFDNIGTIPGANAVTLTYPQITFSGDILVADGVSYYQLGTEGYDPSQSSPPYHNSYQSMEFSEQEVSPPDDISMTLSTPVKEIDFDFFESNLETPFSMIEVLNSAGQEVYQCDGYYYMLYKTRTVTSIASRMTSRKWTSTAASLATTSASTMWS